MAEKEKEQEKDGKAGAAAPPPKKGLNKMLLIIIAAAVLVAGGGAGGFFFLKGKATAGDHGDKEEVASLEEHNAAPKEEHGAKESKDSKHGAKGAAEGASVKLDPFIVNLQDNAGTRYLKVTLDLEVTSAAAGAELNANNTKIRDSLIILLSSKNYADIGSVEGKYQLRDEIVTRINQFLTKSKVKTAYFTEFVVQ